MTNSVDKMLRINLGFSFVCASKMRKIPFVHLSYESLGPGRNKNGRQDKNLSHSFFLVPLELLPNRKRPSGERTRCCAYAYVCP